ncbi:SGNH/GDSL hydrolase family protein [Streptomyces sp. NBC_01465]|uniref:SGNH/GDSL hydrolase family protein n=1 Tax=Streptomyces sp. NBC_01465 TaxID=2903878 RepID=UPI002E3702D8|nr:SGNH/GDSL hydrolase family protein [Streptomyces sp. NBC_01465]
MKSTRVLLALAVAACALAAAPAHAETGPPYKEYVALGDSWSADVTPIGIDSTYAPSGCAQSSWNYPKQVAKALGVPVFRDATCGSATTVEMTKAQDVNIVPGLAWGTNAPQFDRLTPTTDLVTLGIGGNDVGLAGAAKGCINLLPQLTLIPGVHLPAPLGGSCKSGWVKPDGTDLMSQKIKDTQHLVEDAVKGIKDKAPHARILVVDYLAGVPVDHGCYPYVQALDDDLEWLGAKLKEIDAMLARVAADTDTTFVDTYTGSIGHDVCEAPGTKWVEGVIPLSTNPPGLAIPFHPNQLGANHQAATVLETLKK